ncbi:MAG: glycoside hydrolase family 27 protein [Clostridia bacterium]
MKRNGMCPICYFRQFFTKPSNISDNYNNKIYDSGVALTPPMGWSTWNTFRNRINQDMLLEMATTMKEKGLIDAGYQYFNLDDNWQSSLRDENGDLQGDLTTFSMGIPSLIKKLNEIGLKVGLYTSNGTLTCEDLPSSLGREKADAYTFAKWGAEYFKYDFCHNIPYSQYAPLVYGIGLSPIGSGKETFYSCMDTILFGNAKLMNCKKVIDNKCVTGLDANHGAMLYNNIEIEEDGEFILTIHIKKKGHYAKYLLAQFDDTDNYFIDFPSQNFGNYTARFQTRVQLTKGTHTLKLLNPIGTSADSSMLQYQLMGRCLIEATERVAKENGTKRKPIVYSICEWGRNKPWKWGSSAGNLWRTTPDIRPIWPWMMLIYGHTVKLFNSSSKGHYNDPDMLEVGNGKLTYDENISHFSLWCMLNAPLILGNDLRKMNDEVLSIVTNKDMIAINQDKLTKQAKRIKKGRINVLAKPLEDGKVAVCVFNRSKLTKNYNLDINRLVDDEYIKLAKSDNYNVKNIWANTNGTITDSLKSQKIKGHSCCVYIIEKA